jgi:hypothetical protein
MNHKRMPKKKFEPAGIYHERRPIEDKVLVM